MVDFKFKIFLKFALTVFLQIAKKLKLKINEVDFYEPFMEEPVTIPGKPYVESELVEYIEQHDRWVKNHVVPSMLIDTGLFWQDIVK